jgi:hypothetical protein
MPSSGSAGGSGEEEDPVQAVHTLSKAQILRLAVHKRATGELYDLGLAQTESATRKRTPCPSSRSPWTR